jgi:hypothetical protein
LGVALVVPLTVLITFRLGHESPDGSGEGRNDLLWIGLSKAIAVMVEHRAPRVLYPWAKWMLQGPWRASLIWGLFTVLAASVWLLGLPLLMMFDSPGSSENPWLWIILLGVFSLPLLCALTPLLLWVLYGLGSVMPKSRPWLRRLGHGLQALPLLSPLTVLVGVIGLQLQCGGSFDCQG